MILCKELPWYLQQDRNVHWLLVHWKHTSFYWQIWELKSEIISNSSSPLWQTISAFPANPRWFYKKQQPEILTVSSSCSASPQTFAMRTVLHFPPIESFRKCVNLVCRKGMWSRLLSAKAITVCSRNVRDLLMYIASCWVRPSLCKQIYCA